jgi:hypothetical protein
MGAETSAPSTCRICDAPLERTVVDLGMSPLCENFLVASEADDPEVFYPLHLRVCSRCLLVQLPSLVAPEEIFREYAYFSSFSDSWLDHAARHAETMTRRFALTPESFVVEVASNDGYLLRNFSDAGIPCLGIEPALNVARRAEQLGIETITDFFGVEVGRRIAAERGPADVVIANNVFAHVPDLHDFTGGLAAVLAPGGVATIEVQYLPTLIEACEYDTIYHEHFSYFSLITARRILEEHGLEVFDVELLSTHGGSIRLYAGHRCAHETEPSVGALEAEERGSGYDGLELYGSFRARVEQSKRDLLDYLIEARRNGSTVAGYGAPGKGNTLLNYCGIRTDLVEYIVDRNPYKHGRLTPGTHIPIHPPEQLQKTKPDVILILPWNLKKEIGEQLAYTREWGARLVVPVPEVTELSTELLLS